MQPLLLPILRAVKLHFKIKHFSKYWVFADPVTYVCTMDTVIVVVKVHFCSLLGWKFLRTVGLLITSIIIGSVLVLSLLVCFTREVWTFFTSQVNVMMLIHTCCIRVAFSQYCEC